MLLLLLLLVWEENLKIRTRQNAQTPDKTYLAHLVLNSCVSGSTVSGQGHASGFDFFFLFF